MANSELERRFKHAAASVTVLLSFVLLVGCFPRPDSQSSDTTSESISIPTTTSEPSDIEKSPAVSTSSNQISPQAQGVSKAVEEISGVVVASAAKIETSRSRDWGTWNSLTPSCWSVRDESLRIYELSGSATDDDCKFTSGDWYDAYSGSVLTFKSAEEISDSLQLDHIIPVSYAFRHGANLWSAIKRSVFYNDINNFIAVNATDNISKGNSGPSEWMPPNQDYWCTYSHRWVGIAKAWGISFEREDYDKLLEILIECP
ncbi:MAG: HNH endonuclease family protein, partial [Bifidobacteriaceae bacterium]|nr:HNH endonuclease family protein [Bifidobacteriaceae bacterium]